MKILTILFMCCGTLFAADSTNTPAVVFGPPAHIFAGHGEVGQFILQKAIHLGGTPITTNGLPTISDQWSYSEDDTTIYINLTRQDFPAVESFLHQSFGQPAWRYDASNGCYELTPNSGSIYFTEDAYSTHILISSLHRTK